MGATTGERSISDDLTDLQWRSIASITMSQIVAGSKEDKRWLCHTP
jgi:hypothetical protein